MNIKVNDLRKYQKLSSHVKGSNIIPIHRYLRFGDGAICKNVNTSFIRYLLPDANEYLLVDENDLYSLLAVTNSSTISITAKKNKIELNDGRDKILVQSPDFKDFQLPEMPEAKGTEVSADFMEAVYKASRFAQFIKDMPSYYGYVHIGENTVCSGDGIIAFHCPVEEDVKMVLDHKIAQIIAKYDIHTFQSSENYYYLHNTESVFGFAKPVIGWFDIRRLFQQKRDYSFTLDASDLTSFNSLSLQLSKMAQVTISNGKFEMDDSILDKHHEREVANVKVPAPFTYNPERMNAIINGLDVEALDFSDSKPAYYISSKDTKGTAIIAKIQKA
jgi:hypothetical protein